MTRKLSISRGLRLAAASTLLAAGALTGTLAGASAALAAGGTVVIARNMDFNSLDPAAGFCDTCQIYFSAVYEPLVGLAADNATIVPRLASKWEVNADQTKFTFTIADGAVFADGSPVEAKDVKWSLERLANLKGSPSFLMDGVTGIEAPDAKTVVISLAAPNGEFLGILTAPYTGAVNSDVAAQHGALAGSDASGKDTAEKWFVANSAGSGPFVLTSYKPDDELRLARNPKYWGAKPAVDEVVIKQVKDAVTQAQMLESGAADIAMQVDPDTAKSVRSPDVKIETVPSYNFVYVALSPGAKSNKVKLTKTVREAFGHALDYQGAVDFTVGGDGKLQPAPIPNGFPGTKGLPAPKQDLAKAKALLAEAGHPDGFELEAKFPAMNVYGVDLSLLMQKVQQDVAKAGIKVTLSPLTFSVWREQVSGDGIPLTAVFYAPDYYGSGQYAQYFGMTKGAPWAKRAKLADDELNPRAADLLAKALASSGKEMEGHFNQIALEMIGDRIIFPLVSPNLILAYRKDLAGVRYSACCNLPLWELKRN